jgi:hypothetical protein
VTDENRPALPPEREEAVRRLLGDPGDDTGLPPEVAARLDATLADLHAERAGGHGEGLAPVVPLPHRRRRAVAGLFVAAAVAVVAGIGVPLLHDDSSRAPTASSDSSLVRPSGEAAGGASTGIPHKQSDGLGYAAKAPSASGAPRSPHLSGTRDDAQLDRLEASGLGGRSGGAGAVRLDPHRLRPGLLRLRGAIPPDATYSSGRVTRPAGFTCARARFGRGVLIGVRYAGDPAVVAFRAPVGSTQVAEVLQCGTGAVLRSVTLPTR